MTTELHYEHSPLTEAVIDIRVKLPEAVTFDVLATARGRDESAYPIVNKYVQGQVEVAIGDEITTTGSGAQTGFIFASANERQIARVSLDGFTFIRRAPYENWASFRDEARRWWDAYRAVAKPEMATRIAVRYINRLNIPLPFDDFKEYLRVVPDIAPDLPQAWSGFNIQLQIPQEDRPVMLLLNETLAPQDNPEIASIIGNYSSPT
jgi:uncharacterized protein (TIGR04255 family)